MSDFFSKIGEGLKEFGDSVADKTHEVTESARIDKQVKENESVITKMYAEIGEKYYNAYKDDPTAEFAEENKVITKAKDNIAALKAQLNIVKGIFTCTSCGAEVSLSASFCPKCGAKIIPPAKDESKDKVAAPGKRICKGCGSEVPEESTFCTVCGMKKGE